ncbi:MAG: hypothetical protein IPN94_26540 [Sphingobacteriales bacterium]|nr:hypothetical protein [Sphingobacteriales bacterium]
MQTNNRLIALFCLGVLLGAALTILVGRYTHTLYLASDYEPLLKEMGESLEMAIPIMQLNIDEEMTEFNKRVKKEVRGKFLLLPAQSVQKKVVDYLEQAKKTPVLFEQVQTLQNQLLMSIDTMSFNKQQHKSIIEKRQPIKINSVSPFMQQLNTQLQQLNMVMLEKKIVDILYERFGKDLIVCSTDVILLPNSTYLVQGDKFELKVGLVCHTTSLNNVQLFVDDKQVEENGGDLVYVQKECNKIGEQQITGSLVVMGEDSLKRTYPFTQRYTVVKPCR